MLKFLAVGSVDYVMLAIIGIMLVLIVVMLLIGLGTGKTVPPPGTAIWNTQNALKRKAIF